MDDKVIYWIDLSDYDFERAKAMLESRRFLYVGFMCHQTIEARYPSHKERLMKSLTESRCKEIIQKTENIQEWVKKKL